MSENTNNKQENEYLFSDRGTSHVTGRNNIFLLLYIISAGVIVFSMVVERRSLLLKVFSLLMVILLVTFFHGKEDHVYFEEGVRDSRLLLKVSGLKCTLHAAFKISSLPSHVQGNPYSFLQVMDGQENIEYSVIVSRHVLHKAFSIGDKSWFGSDQGIKERGLQSQRAGYSWILLISRKPFQRLDIKNKLKDFRVVMSIVEKGLCTYYPHHFFEILDRDNLLKCLNL
ncbi:MAG: hypothetical protein ACTSVI_01090 [Promethearchaeota archaeon]